MNDNLFDGLVVFCSVIEEGSFTAAAKALHHTTSHISKEVARLERRLGTRLMNRTTRKISLTESGRIFYENSRRIIDDAESTHSQILSTEDRPFGHLKVSVPVMFSDACLNPWLPDFAGECPDVTLDIEISDRYVDIVAEGFDVVVRAGALDDSDFIARKLMRTRQLTVASPAYLKKHGTPQSPHELSGHSLVSFSFRGIANTWVYQGGDGNPLAVSVMPKIRCNSASMEVALAKSGFGITRIPYLAGEQELGNGTLVPILEAFEIPKLEIHAIYPSRQHLAPKVCAFVDFLAKKSNDHHQNSTVQAAKDLFSISR